MPESTVTFAWRAPHFSERFETGVCLHGHTMHSLECLSFLPRYLHHVPGISQIVGYYEREPHRVDFERAWWTPPLTPASALTLERDQISTLRLIPMVSLTDHDNIDAGLTLGVTADPRETPVSVEWTVPYEHSIFHIGVHNIPRHHAHAWLDAMKDYTAAPCESALPVILDEFVRARDVLIVLNHPFWLEEGVTPELHQRALTCLLGACSGWLDAFELNGTRRWNLSRGRWRRTDSGANLGRA